jgi:hypothetical protein
MSNQITSNRQRRIFSLTAGLGLSVFLTACAVVPPHSGYGYSNRYPVYSQPSTLYVQPRPVYVQPPPFYGQPRPVFVQPRPVHVHPRPLHVQPFRHSPFIPKPFVAPHSHERGLNAIQRERGERRSGAPRQAF